MGKWTSSPMDAQQSSGGEDRPLSLREVVLSAGDSDSIFWSLWKTSTYKPISFFPLVSVSLCLRFHLLNLFLLLHSPEGDQPSRFAQDCPMDAY